MKKIFLLALIHVFFAFSAQAQVLKVNPIIQEYDQWCWAACSKAILDYYGFVHRQCEIAEYTRTRATFADFGRVNCCTNAIQGCNYWNYNYYFDGSIQDILIHFGNIQNTGFETPLTLAEIVTEIRNNQLFLIRWGWSTGGGHFVVGHGVKDKNVYLMNPWFGEGLQINTYNYVLSGRKSGSASHTWTHTNKIKRTVTGLNDKNLHGTLSAQPNPLVFETVLLADKRFNNATLNIYNAYGQEVKEIKNLSGQSITLQRDNLPSGLYILRLTENKQSFTTKLVIAD